jgi:hypothetical protein
MVTTAAEERRRYWKRQRLRYNVAMLVSGLLAGIAFAGVLVAWYVWPPPPEQFEHANFNLFSLVLAPFAYAFAMGVANVFYLLGPLAEIIVRPRKAERFRRVVFLLGTGFSVLLPWTVSVNVWYEFLSVTLHRA